MQFLFGQIPTTLSGDDASLSVLDFLRERQGRCGTKEGCASGDCGACTVVVAETDDAGLSYRAINACITPTGELAGKQLITVEELANGEDYHPVQQALVDFHGSQCGFCTPGFVMSLYAAYQNAEAPDRDNILRTLGGNLCRCTGYRPIIDAAEAALTERQAAPQQDDAETIDQLAQLESGTGSGRYHAPTSIAELNDAIKAHPKARLIAGGTDLWLEVTQLLKRPERLISLNRVEELTGHHSDGNALHIGAAATYEQVTPLLLADYPEMQELLLRLGSLQIRNRGTLGGNIANASPIGDMPPALLALDAQLVLNRQGQTRHVPLETFFQDYRKTILQPGEFIQTILIPRRQPEEQIAFYKISKRLEDDISASCGAFRIRIEDDQVADVRVAFGGMAAIPARALHCEEALRGQAWNEATLKTAMAALAEDFQPIDDFRASADYRGKVSANLLKRFYLNCQPKPDLIRVSSHA